MVKWVSATLLLVLLILSEAAAQTFASATTGLRGMPVDRYPSADVPTRVSCLAAESMRPANRLNPGERVPEQSKVAGKPIDTVVNRWFEPDVLRLDWLAAPSAGIPAAVASSPSTSDFDVVTVNGGDSPKAEAVLMTHRPLWRPTLVADRQDRPPKPCRVDGENPDH